MPKHAHFATDFDESAEVEETTSSMPKLGSHFASPNKDAAVPLIAADSSDAGEPKRHRKLWIIPLVLVVAAAGAYVAGAVHFQDTFFPNTTVNGIDVSGMKPAELAGIVEADAAGWTSTLTGDGLDIALTAENVGLAYDGDELAAEAISEQNPWAWPVEYSKSHTLEASGTVTYDEDKLWSLIEPVVADSQALADTFVDGGIIYDPEIDAYRVQDDATPRHINRSALIAQASPQIIEMSDSVTIDESCLDSDERIEQAIADANSLVGATVELKLGDEVAYTLDSDAISQWVSFDDDLNVVLDEQAIIEFGPGELSEALDTVGTTRTYTRPDGKEITVTGGAYGWSIDGAATSDLILAAIRSGEPSTIDIPTFSEADHVNPGGQEWGAYIDVDRTEQYGRFYDADGNIIWETDLVTGQPNLGRETPEGVWYVTSKERNTELRGPENEEGEPQWISYVDFWMGVVGNSVGLHNAPWRGAYGGDIYTWNGSHGCINMSYEAAEELYGLVEIGVPVIVHN